MKLNGSCHCGLVRFSVESQAAVPYMHCYCTVCRKTGGAGGYMINLGADAATLVVEGIEHTRTYQAMRGETKSRHKRIFCGECGSHLWASNEQWPELVHPLAGAIDSELPTSADSVHIMLNYKANWVPHTRGETRECFDEYPMQNLAQWHQEHDLDD